MSYKSVLVILGCLLADLLLGTFFPGIPPVFLVFGIFFLSQRLSIYEISVLAISAGFIFDLAQLSQTVFTTIFLLIIALSIQYLSKRFIDFTNKFSQILFLVVIFLLKDLSVWLIYDRSWPSHFLIQSLSFSFISVSIASIILLFKNVKIT